MNGWGAFLSPTLFYATTVCRTRALFHLRQGLRWTGREARPTRRIFVRDLNSRFQAVDIQRDKGNQGGQGQDQR